MNWQRRTIVLAQTGCRVFTVEADVYGGHWAVCKVPRQLGRDCLWSLVFWGWEVVHVPTGRLLLGDLTEKRTAVRIARLVARIYDWSQAPDGQPPIETWVQMRAIIQEAKDDHERRLEARSAS